MPPGRRVDRARRLGYIAGEYVVFTDLRGFTQIIETAAMTTVERVLEALFALTGRVAGELGGTVRFSSGDAYCLTFADAGLALTAAERLIADWDALVGRESLPCALNVAVHQGTLYAFRSYLYGPGIDVAASLEGASKDVLAPGEGAIFVTGEVRKGLQGTVWEPRLAPVDLRLRRHAGIEAYRLGKGRSGDDRE